MYTNIDYPNSISRSVAFSCSISITRTMTYFHRIWWNQCLVVMSCPSPVASPHASNDKGDEIGREAVVATYTSKARASNNHDGVASFLVELSHSVNNMMLQ